MSETRVLGNIRLLEVFSDFPVVIRGDYAGRHKAALYVKTPKSEDIRIDIEKLKKTYAELAKRNQGKQYEFICERVEIAGQVYWRFGRRDRDTEERKKLRNIPLYYSTTLRRLYIPKSYATKKKRLVSSAIMYRCKDLGISLRTEVKRPRGDQG